MGSDDRGSLNTNESFASSLGRAIKVIRAERDWSRRDLARRADISVSYVSEIENGRKPPSSPVLVRIAEALGLLPSDLLARAEKRVPRVASAEAMSLLPTEPGRGMLMSKGNWFHQAAAPSAGPRNGSGALSQPESGNEGDLEEAQEEMRELLVRMPVGDRERLLDLARRLAR